MSEHEIDQDSTTSPSDDVETLYSWANLSGAKYRDFSPARAQARERLQARLQAEVEEKAIHAAEAERQAVVESALPPVQPVIPAPAQSSAPVFAAPPAVSADHSPTLPADFNLPSNRPAWLYAEPPRPAAPIAPPQPSAANPEAGREAAPNRWFALKGVFSSGPVAAEVMPAATTLRIPMTAVFSLAGGVGKTSLVATLGRSLSARGERVLLIDTAPYGLLPFYFGARDQRPGVVRTFTPPSATGDAPIQMLNLDPESFAQDATGHDSLVDEVYRHARGSNRVLIDLATASGSITRRILKLSPVVIVPILPDMNSVVSLASIEAFFSHNYDGQGIAVKPVYVLNQFDPALPLHLDVREVLREQLGDRLLPFALRRSSAVSEALAEGMTVVDYAPSSSASDDYQNLSTWIRNLSAPAQAGYRGVRWSER